MDDTLTSFLYRVKDDWPMILVELTLIGLCVNWCAGVLQSTRGTRPLRGLLLVMISATIVVHLFGWERLDLLYRYVLVGLGFVGLVVFQPELRRALIRAGDVPFHRTRGPHSQLVSALVKSAGYLSRNRYGALIAIQRDVDLTGWAENGTVINAEVSANLVNSIFFPNSPLHDLGVIIRGTRVLAANCQFPSPDSDEVDAALGSRHLAAVGMSYESDALVLVVSEETGVISLADNGRLTRYLTLDDLAEELKQRLDQRGAPAAAATQPKRTLSLLWRRVRRVLVVLPLTAVIWYIADQATFVNVSVDVRLDIGLDDPSRIVEVTAPLANIVDVDDPRSIVFTTRFRGPARAIDQLRSLAPPGKRFAITWVLPEAYARPGAYQLSATQLRDILDSMPDVVRRGVVADQVVLKEDLRLVIDELTTVTARVKVANEMLPLVATIDPETVEVRIPARRASDLPPPPQREIRAPLGQDRLKNLEPGDVRRFNAVPLERRLGTVDVVRVNPPEVSVEVEVVRGTRQRIRNIVVQLLVSPELPRRFDVRKADINEWLIDVEIAGKEERIRGLGPADIQAFVQLTSDLAPPQETAAEFLRLLEVKIIAPEGVSVVADHPRTVRVLLTPRAGATP
jgi:diadenylate cyclase